MISLTASMRLDEARCLLEDISTAYCGALTAAHDSVVDVKGLQAWEHREELGAIAARGRQSLERLNTSELPAIERSLRAAHRHQTEKIRELVSNMAAENQNAETPSM